MNKNNLSQLKKEVEDIKSTLDSRGTEEGRALNEMYDNMTWLEKLQFYAETAYSTPFSEDIARCSLKMSLEEFKSMIRAMSEKELFKYLEPSFGVFTSLKGTEQEQCEHINKLSAEIINKIKAESV